MEQYLHILEKLPLFSGISHADIVPLCRQFGCHTARYGRGEFLWMRGEQVKEAGIVLSGSVQAEQNSADGTQHVVARHSAGALFGDVLMSSQMQRSPVDIVACEETLALFLPLENMMRNFSGGTEAAQVRFRLNLLGEIADKYWVLYRRMAYLTEPTLRGRLSRYLFDLRAEQGSDTVKLSCTREALSAILGVNRSAMCRELGRMQREGLIGISRRSVTLCDPEKLKLLAER